MPGARLLRRLAILSALLAPPAVAGAAPITVTYEITGGIGFEDQYEGQLIQSGVVVVTFPNPGSGSPPLDTVGHSIYVHFLTASAGGGFPGTFKRTFTSAEFTEGTAYRGVIKTSRAHRRRDTCPSGFYTYEGVRLCHAPTGFERFRIQATANGEIDYANWLYLGTNEGTPFGFFRISGQEVASTPEPASGSLLALGAVAVAAALAARAVPGRSMR